MVLYKFVRNECDRKYVECFEIFFGICGVFSLIWIYNVRNGIRELLWLIYGIFFVLGVVRDNKMVDEFS